jgi:hypothetical protein
MRRPAARLNYTICVGAAPASVRRTSSYDFEHSARLSNKIVKIEWHVLHQLALKGVTPCPVSVERDLRTHARKKINDFQRLGQSERAADGGRGPR